MTFRRLMVAVMIAAIACGPSSWATERPVVNTIPAATSELRIHDVRLSETGLLRGAVVDAQGRPRTNVLVTLDAADGQTTQVITNHEGCFAAKIHGGVYRVRCLDVSQTCRIWSHAAAPPLAQDAILAVADSSVELGQLGKRFPGGRGQAWLIGGALLGVAVVLPLIDNKSDGS